MKIGMKQSNVKIAITGGICSGKTSVAQIIRQKGYTVISCDEIYGKLLEDRNFINLLIGEFGEITNADGALDRSKLSEIVFNDREKLKKLNSITHLKIIQRAFEQMTGGGVFFCEVPLLFEGAFEKLFDGVIVVLRKLEDRIAALTQRNNISKNQALNRINSQFDYDNCNFITYYVIHNDKDLIKLQDDTLIVLKKIEKDYF